MSNRLKDCCVELLWRGFERVPEPVAKFAGHARRAVAPLRELRVPIAWYSGKTPGSLRARILTAGAQSATKYFLGRIFAESPTCTAHGSVLLTSLPRALRELRGEADLTIAETDRIASRFLFGSDYLRVPSWVRATMPVPEDMHALARKSSSTRSDLKLVQKSGIRFEETHSRADFDAFCHDMYLPFARQRHGAQLVVRTPGFLRRCFRKGGVDWILLDNQRVAGSLYSVEGDVLKVLCFGTVGGDYEPVLRGALAALYLMAGDLAKSRGCTMLDFGGTRPCARDGVLQFKRKWGMTFASKPDVRVDLLMRWERSGPFMQEFLTHSPVLFRQGGGLSLLAASSTLPPQRLRDQLWVNGIDRMHMIGDVQASDRPLPEDVVLSDPLHGSEVLNALPQRIGESRFPSSGTPGEGQDGGRARWNAGRHSEAAWPPTQPSPGVPGEGDDPVLEATKLSRTHAQGVAQ